MKLYIKIKNYILYFLIIIITFILIYNIFYIQIIREDFSLGGAGKSIKKVGKSSDKGLSGAAKSADKGLSGAGKSADKGLSGAGKSIEKTATSGVKSAEKVAEESTKVVKKVQKETTELAKDVGKGIQQGVSKIEDTLDMLNIEAALEKLFNSILKLGKIFEKLPNQVTSIVNDTTNLKLNITKGLQNI
jgi:vacuolar-type H+-ATPase subunit H